MILFGLTGGVASGKSSVSKRFRARGLTVLDADRIARDVVEPGSPGLAALVEAFGAIILDAEGGLQRSALGTIVFADPEARQRLNGILHPRIGAETARRTAALADEGCTMAAYDAALLVENGLVEAFRPLVVVAAPPDLQRRRIMARDGLSEGEAQARIEAQLPLADKVAAADHIIHNVGTLAQLRVEADAVLDRIASEAGLPLLPPVASSSSAEGPHG